MTTITADIGILGNHVAHRQSIAEMARARLISGCGTPTLLSSHLPSTQYNEFTRAKFADVIHATAITTSS